MQEEKEVTRYTFVVQVHPDGLSTLENLSTHERIRVTDLATVGPQIEDWLKEHAGSGSSDNAKKRTQ
jgi:hypothetical protein